MEAQALTGAAASPALVSRRSWPGGLPLAGEAEGRLLRSWLVRLIGGERFRLLLVLVLSLVAAAAGLAQPLLTRHLIDNGILAASMDEVQWTAQVMLAMLCSASLLGLATRRLYIATSARILHGLREEVFTHLLQLPPSFYARVRQGDLLSRLEGDLGEIQRFALDTLLVAINSIVILVGAFIVLSMLSVELTLVTAALLLFNTLAARSLRPRLEAAIRAARETGADIASFLVEVLGAAKCVQAFSAEPRERHRLRTLHDAQREHTLHLQTVGYLATGLPNVVLGLGTIGLFVWGSYQVIGGTLTLGVLVAFATYFQRATAPLQSLLGLYVAWQRARVSFNRVAEVLAVQAAPAEAGHPSHAAIRGDLEFCGVEFAYPDSQRLFAPLTCALPRGSRVALRGPSGAGKSTLVDILHGHLQPTAGRVLLDGQDTANLDRRILRQSIAVVSQETSLFSMSIAENIRYGRADASDEEVRRAAELAGLDGLIGQLPDGLATFVGQRGLQLSGGERQRIALARAILVDPLILVIDEGTSGLDAQLEARILAETDRLFKDRTRIQITHRPIDEAAFDRVIDLTPASAT